MAHIDFTPLFSRTVGFDQIADLMESALRSDTTAGYPPYNIEVVEENQYQITIAVAGFNEDEVEVEVENGVLTVRGKKGNAQQHGKFLHKGIAFRSFERKFNLADHVEVKGADLHNGLLVIDLLKVIPEQMRARRIPIGGLKKVVDAESVNGSSQAA